MTQGKDPGGTTTSPDKAGNANKRPEKARVGERGSATNHKKNPGKRPSQGGNAR